MTEKCPYCRGDLFDVLFQAPDFDTGEKTFQLHRCRQCGLVRTEPVLSGSEMMQYYSLSYYGAGKVKFTGPAEGITKFFNHSRARTVLSHVRGSPEMSSSKPAKVLDIGCGRGNLLMSLKHLGCECHGVEREEFPKDGLPQDIMFHTGELNNIAFDGNSFDAVIIWHVLEHVEDPVAMIGEASRILRPGGLLAIAVPNFGSLQAELFKKDWFHLDLPRHIYHFTPGTLAAIIEKFGFSISNKTTFSAEQNIFGFIQSTLNRIAPRRRPNRFYALLKKRGEHPSSAALLLWAALACLVFPFAVIEHLASGLSGKGATLIIYSKKRGTETQL